jgi:hypothetical protein
VPNGIRILEYLGYPEEITEEAFRETGYVGLKAPEENITTPQGDEENE